MTRGSRVEQGTTVRWVFRAGKPVTQAGAEEDRAAKELAARWVGKFQRAVGTQTILGQANRVVNEAQHEVPPWLGDAGWTGWLEYREGDGAAHRYSVEKWVDRSQRVYLLRTGPLIYLDQGKSALLEEADLRAAAGPGVRVILVKSLSDSVLSEHPTHRSNQRVGPYSYSFSLALRYYPDWTGKLLIDVGAGASEVSMVPGVPVIAIEHDAALAAAARENFRANGLVEDRDFFLVPADIGDAEAVRREFRLLKGKLAAAGLSLQSAVLASNIGTWPGFYSVNNETSMDLIPLIRQELGLEVSAMIGGGVPYSDPERAAGRLREDLDAARRRGFRLNGSGRFYASRTSARGALSDMDTASWVAVPDSGLKQAGAEEISADNLAWEVAPGSRIYLIPDEVMELLMRQEPAVAEGLTVQPLPEQSRQTQISLHLSALFALLPRLTHLPEAQKQELQRRLFTEGNILIRRSVERGHLREVLKHEIVQQLAYPYASVLNAGIQALMGSPWKELFTWLNQTEYANRLGPGEFAGQWAQRADVFNDAASLEEDRRGNWTAMKENLSNAVKANSPEVPPALRDAVKIWIRLESEGDDLTARYLKPLLEGLDRNPLLSGEELTRLPPDVQARLLAEGRKRVSDDPQFIKTLSGALFMFLASELRGKTNGEISAEQFSGWLSKKRILLLGEGEGPSFENSVFGRLLRDTYGVQNVTFLERGRMGKLWAETEEPFDLILSVLAYNKNRVPGGMDPKSYWLLQGYQNRLSLAPGGLAVHLINREGNEDLAAAFPEFGLDSQVRMSGSIVLVARKDEGSPGGVVETMERIAQEISEVQAGAEQERGARSGAPRPGLSEVTASWDEVATTPAKAVGKRLLPLFYDIGTFHALPLIVRAKIAFVVVAAPDEEGMVRALLNAVRAPETQYRLVVSQDKADGIAKAQAEYAGNYRVHLVNKVNQNWLQELLAGLEAEGIIPIGDWEPALQRTERYLQGLA